MKNKKINMQLKLIAKMQSSVIIEKYCCLLMGGEAILAWMWVN
jgi:hypothetical protein